MTPPEQQALRGAIDAAAFRALICAAVAFNLARQGPKRS